ncbi:hypothetical protein Bca4012_068890 [Brassica carinata]
MQFGFQFDRRRLPWHLANARKIVSEPPSHRPHQRSFVKMKKIIEGSHVTTTNITVPKSSSSSRTSTSKELGSSSKEEDAPNDQVESQIAHLSLQEEEVVVVVV